MGNALKNAPTRRLQIVGATEIHNATTSAPTTAIVVDVARVAQGARPAKVENANAQQGKPIVQVHVCTWLLVLNIVEPVEQPAPAARPVKVVCANAQQVNPTAMVLAVRMDEPVKTEHASAPTA